MQFNEKEPGYENGAAENYLYSKLSQAKIRSDSFSTTHNSLKDEGCIRSYSRLDIEFEKHSPENENSKQSHLRDITGWRRAITEDSPAIKHLQNLTGDIANTLYRKRNIDELIEKSYFPIVQLDSNGELISFTAYDPFPNIPAVPSFFWNDWLSTTYRLKGASPRNVLFIHYMVWQPGQSKRFLRLLLETSFTEFLHLDHLIIVKPPHAIVPDFYEEHFIPVLPCDWDIMNFNSIQSLLVCLRTSIIHSLPIRTAFEEEFDAIVPFIESHIDSQNLEGSCMLDFVNFIYNEQKKTLICEFDGSVAGLMILNLKIDLDFLNEGFELAPFNGLRKKDLGEDEISEGESYIIPSQSSKLSDRPNVLISSEFLFSKMHWELTMGKAKETKTDSTVHMKKSSESLISSSYSDFSLDDVVSLFDIRSSYTDTDQSNKVSVHGRNECLNKVDVRVEMRTSISAVPHFYYPKYRGSSNAFIIDFFAIDTNAIDKKLSSYEFLEAAFKVIPDRDYCVLIIPTNSLPISLLDLFVRVTPRLMSTFKHELYLCHKSSLFATSMLVRSTKEDDMVPINSFLKNIKEHSVIYRDVQKSLLPNECLQSYVLTVEEKIVGVSVLDTRNSTEHLQFYFDVTDYTSLQPGENENPSVIKHFILNPIYHSHVRFFVRDLMRLADVTCLYYIYQERDKDDINMLNILGDLIPIKPKRKVGIDECVLRRNLEKNNHVPACSLHLTNSRFCGFSKIQLNIVIVVVGASRTALSFLENLIFGSNRPYVIYNNLICVTPQALEWDTKDGIYNLMFPIRDNFTRKYVSMLSLETYVSFIYGVMTEINRSEKYIVINNKAIVKYDYLILTCGLQYLSPVPKARELPKNRCKKFYNSSLAKYLYRSQPKKHVQPKHPINLFVINTISDAKNALHTSQRLINKTKASFERKIIIYGHNLQAFLTINALIKLGIPGEVIVFVEPFPSNGRKVTVFNDYEVDQAVLESISNLKIMHYKEYFLYDWTMSSEEYITTVTFQSKRKQVIIPCLAFFPFERKLVSDITFNACANAGLVYDGKLVINHTFKTNDDYIYAAGSFTKYARRYYAIDQEHQYYNSAEIGLKLANILRSKVDPTAEDKPDNETSELVPNLESPLLLYCQLPGELNFLVVRKPGKELDLETSYNFRNYGDVLTTGDSKSKKGYFRLHLDSHGFVESITCLTKDEIDYVSLYELYGLHEKLLNSLLLRYDLGLVPDLFAYFRAPWAQALFHENFKVLRNLNYRAFKKKPNKKSGKTFGQRVVKKLDRNKWSSLPNSLALQIQNEYKSSKIERQIKRNVMQFLECHQKDLPFYAVPPAFFRPEDRKIMEHLYSSYENIDELLVNKRKPRCFPNSLRPFKPPLVTSSDFPSSIALTRDEPLMTEGHFGEGDSVSAKHSTQVPKKSPISYWRRAEHMDTEAVCKLIAKSNYTMNDLFGEPDIPNLIEKSIFSIVQFNGNKELISFMSAFSYPNIPAVPSFEWYTWLENTYWIKDATPRNTFFIHYMIWEAEYYHEFLRLTLETMFLEFTFLTHVIIIKPPKVKIPNILAENFIQVLPRDSKIHDCDFGSLQTVLLCLKHSLMERLRIRLAMVEDHDDLMPIVEQHTERLRQLYGDFCMAEIIEYPGTTDRKTLVCESMGYAVGFMNINRAVDFDLLNSQFDLGGFNGLRKPDENDMNVTDIQPDDSENEVFFPDEIDPYLDIVSSEQILRFLNWQPSLCASDVDFTQTNLNVDEPLRRYNELSKSMSMLLRETLDLKLAPKFSAHALSSSVVAEGIQPSDFLSGTTLRSYTVKADEPPSETEVSTARSKPSLVSLEYYNLPKYHGKPNAFCIEFFAMHNNFDDRLCHDFLEAAFEVFPDLDYCLFTIPSQAPTFPLLDSFTRVTPRPLKRFKQELYVCHKSSVMVTFMRVRRIVKSDLTEIRGLLNGIKNKESIYADVASSCYYEDSAYQGFVLICFNSIVGVAVLCNENEMEYLAHHYHVCDLIDFDLHKIDYHAILKHLILSPIYHPHARFFLRDIMRMADVTSLYRTRYEEVESNWSSSSVINVLGHLVPVRPRRMIKYHEPSLGSNIPPPYFFHRDEPFSLYHINARICGLKKFTSNINVVIIGASKTALSFLETLLFSPSAAYVMYNNITLVSPHGMGTELPSHRARDFIFPFKGKFSRYYEIQVCLKTYVNFVYGVMTHINRVDKYIRINNDFILPYDYLILCCGRQFAMPVPYSQIPEFKKCQRNYRPRCTLFKYLLNQQNKEQELNSIYPPNVFVINTTVDATNAFISLQYLMHKREGFPTNEKIVIYGHNLRTYLCVQALMKFGIPAYMIVVVEPFPKGCNSISCLKDRKIDQAVLKTLKSLNIEHYTGYELYEWSLCENKQIQSATFHTENRKITIKCLAMFPFERRVVSEVTFKACNEASLVYDGKLVINSNFQTNDEFIYAAGGMTKYKRKYYATDRNHRHYSPSEVGKLLAEIIRKKIDPTVEVESDEPTESVPNMTDPVVISGTLPDDWNFLRVRKPGKVRDLENNTTIQELGSILTTGDCDMSNGYGYFKLTLDDCGFVQDIVCYTKDTIDVANLEMLYGKHEKLLNDLLVRFDLGMIKDFYSYFREPWVYAIYHDRFKLLQEDNYQHMLECKISDKDDKIVNLVVNALKSNNWNRLNNEKLKEIRVKFNQSKVKKQIIDNILDFLYYFDEPFPMYATPKIIRVLLHDATTSLLHKGPSHEPGVKSTIRISEAVKRY